jgi:predicted  nucleic acid-binding Zn-ribbon protein
VHPDLEALLALQADDRAVADLERRERELAGRVAVLDKERQSLVDAITRSREALAAEEKRQRELTGKVQDHKQLQEKNLAMLDAVRKPREAAAAMSQIDLTRKVLAQEESDLHGLSTRIHDMRTGLQLQELELSETDERQQGAREQLAEDRRALEAEMEEARAKRASSATRVPRTTLSKYDRIRGRGTREAIVALRNNACGNCNTAIPLQRRNVIAGGRSIDVCEGCGVLLYATG